MKTRPVKPNRNLKTMLDTNAEMRADYDRRLNNQVRKLLNALATLYAADPQTAWAAMDQMQQDRDKARATATAGSTGAGE